MSADIPRSVMEEAHKIALHGGYSRGTMGYLALFEAIARALLARDKRAAEIAWGALKDDTPIDVVKYAAAIAKSITTYPEGKEDGL